MNMTDSKIDINRVRGAAKRQGLTLVKSRRRDRLALDFGYYIWRGRRELAHFRELADAERWIAHPEDR
jgi:hypothetical protein